MVGKILIVDSVATNRIVFKVALGDAFYLPVFATDGEDCLQILRHFSPDLILIDMDLPDQPGSSVITRLRAQSTLREIPILALTDAYQASMRLLALRAGADDVMDKTVDIQTLLARIRNLMRGRESIKGLATGTKDTELLGLAEAPSAFERPASISLIGGQTKTSLELQQTLPRLLTDKVNVQSRENAFLDANQTNRNDVPDVFLIEADASGFGNAFRLMSELRSMGPTQHSSVCLLRHKSCPESSALAYDMGADDVVDVGVAPAEIALRLRVLIRRKREADQVRASVQDGLRLAVFDPLTGLHNRRYALPQLASIAESAHNVGALFAVMIIDLDKFKSVNDKLGHAAGDTVLVEVAQRLLSSLRADDLVARIGGEEFLVGLSNTNFDEACAAADRLCRAIEERPISVGISSNIHVTVSIGLAISSKAQRVEAISDIVERADCALRIAKEKGRNQVNISRNAA
jgi:two-component system, cell cycle response regulator